MRRNHVDTWRKSSLGRWKSKWKDPEVEAFLKYLWKRGQVAGVEGARVWLIEDKMSEVSERQITKAHIGHNGLSFYSEAIVVLEQRSDMISLIFYLGQCGLACW